MLIKDRTGLFNERKMDKKKEKENILFTQKKTNKQTNVRTNSVACVCFCFKYIIP